MQGAAEDKARELLVLIRQRGCTEPFTPAPELLDDGVVGAGSAALVLTQMRADCAFLTKRVLMQAWIDLDLQCARLVLCQACV